MTSVAASSSPLDDALACVRSGRLDEAETLARQHLGRDPHDAEMLNVLGGIAYARGDAAQASRFYAEALRWRPDFAKAHNNLGALYIGMERYEDALRHLRAALDGDRDFTDARVNLGTALLNMGRYAEAEEELRAAVGISAHDALAWNSLGNALFHLARLDEAIAAFERAIAIEPGLVMALNNLGTAWREKGEVGKAEDAYRRALTMAPNHAEAWGGLGVLMREQGRYDEALAAQNRALELKPSFNLARFSRALLELGDGQFGEGFCDYLARDVSGALPGARHILPSDLAGRRVLLLPDQGLGDEVFFLRFAPALKRRGAHLIYSASPALASLLARCGAVDEVVDRAATVPPCDLTLSIGDLPYVLEIKAAQDLPRPLPLPASPEKSAVAAETLARCGPPPYVALTWRAGTRDWNALLKAVPVAELGRALAGLRATFISLQRAPAEGETAALAAALGAPVHDLGRFNQTLEDMLALLHRIDIYAGVSNTNTHLRAGTGRIAHVLIPHPPEWRWMNRGARSPWFPDFPLYRQAYGDQRASGWEAALAALRRDVAVALNAGLAS